MSNPLGMNKVTRSNFHIVSHGLSMHSFGGQTSWYNISETSGLGPSVNVKYSNLKNSLKTSGSDAARAAISQASSAEDTLADVRRMIMIDKIKEDDEQRASNADDLLKSVRGVVEDQDAEEEQKQADRRVSNAEDLLGAPPQSPSSDGLP